MFTSNSNFLVILGELYLVILFVRAILSWFPYDANSPLNPIRRVVFTVTEPVLAPFRRIIPPIGMIDFCSGVTYALAGSMDKVADQVFLLTPTNVEVSAEEKRRLQERGYRS